MENDFEVSNNLSQNNFRTTFDLCEMIDNNLYCICDT